MAKQKILVIEDEEDILELVRYNLAREGFQVLGYTSGEEGLAAVETEQPDLIILDLMLPGIDGLDVCKTLKRNPATAATPIIMLTAKGEEADVVTGLELGAEDYIAKPFSPRVLLARLKVVLRRKPSAPEKEGEILRAHRLSIHPGRFEVTVDRKRVDLTPTEFRILHLLARRAGWVFTRGQIVDAVRGEDYAVTERAVDVQIVGLRKKLGEYGQCIETVRGVGYRFQDNAEDDPGPDPR